MDGRPMISFSSPDALKEILTKTDKFTRRQIQPYHTLKDLLGGLVTFEGEKWKRDRRIITPLFHYGGLKAMIPVIADITQQMISFLEAQTAPIESKFIEEWTLRVIITVAFGNAFDVKWMAKQFGEFGRAMHGVFALCAIFGDYAKYIPFPSNIAMWRVQRAIGKKIVGAMQERKKVLQGIANGSKEHADLLSLLVSTENVDDQTIIGEGMTFLFGGFDTTSKLMEWVFYYLAKHPDVQSKVYDEVISVLGKDGSITELETLNQLVYCKQVLLETLRMRPPATVLDRYVTEDCELDGLKVPKGVIVNLGIHQVHLDPKYWSNPTTFMPERFAKENNHHPFAFIPFSAAERNCIGQKLALQEAQIFLAAIIQRFKIESPNLEEVFMATAPMLRPMKLKVKFSKRI